MKSYFKLGINCDSAFVFAVEKGHLECVMWLYKNRYWIELYNYRVFFVGNRDTYDFLISVGYQSELFTLERSDFCAMSIYSEWDFRTSFPSHGQRSVYLYNALINNLSCIHKNITYFRTKKQIYILSGYCVRKTHISCWVFPDTCHCQCRKHGNDDSDDSHINVDVKQESDTITADEYNIESRNRKIKRDKTRRNK